MAPRAVTVLLVLGFTLFMLSWQLFCLRGLSFSRPDDHRRISSVIDDSRSSQSSWSPSSSASSSSDVSPSLADSAHQLCSSHGFSPFQPQPGHPRRKVYDLIMVHTELDMLEVRLRTLHAHVDYFIIVESGRTFQGHAKNLTVRDSWARFAPFHDKMVHHELAFPRRWNPRRPWDFEDLQRDATYEQVFPLLARERSPRSPARGDVLLVSDVDEIPRPETVAALRACRFPRRTTLASRFYYYSFQFLHEGPEWPHPQATEYQGWRTLRPTSLRNGDGWGQRISWAALSSSSSLLPLSRWRSRGGKTAAEGGEEERAAGVTGVMRNASWHCSSCFGTMDRFLDKMASFSHTWMNADEFRDKNRIADAVRRGVDVWGREADRFTRLERNEDVPPPLLRHPPAGGRSEYSYMLNRDGESAGFSDYP